MIEQEEERNPVIDFLGWWGVNLVLILIFVVTLYFSLRGSGLLAHAGIAFGFGGGLIIAACQSLYLRLRQIKIPGGLGWMAAGFISSIVGALWFLFATLMLYFVGDNLVENSTYSINEVVFDWILVILCPHLILLGIAQSILLKIAHYQKVFSWFLDNVFGYILLLMVVFIQLSLEIRIALSILLIVLLTFSGARLFMQILKTRVIKKEVSAPDIYPQSIPGEIHPR